MSGKVDVTVVHERDSLRLKQLLLNAGSPEREPLAKAAVFEKHAMARYIATVGGRRRIASQGKPDVTRRLRSAHKAGNLPVRSHLPDRNLTHNAENVVRKLSHLPVVYPQKHIAT